MEKADVTGIAGIFIGAGLAVAAIAMPFEISAYVRHYLFWGGIITVVVGSQWLLHAHLLNRYNSTLGRIVHASILLLLVVIIVCSEYYRDLMSISRIKISIILSVISTSLFYGILYIGLSIRKSYRKEKSSKSSKEALPNYSLTLIRKIYVGWIYVDFQHLKDQSFISIVLTCYNGRAKPVRFAMLKGHVKIEPALSYKANGSDFIRPTLMNPFERDWWQPGEEIILEIQQRFSQRIAEELHSRFSNGHSIGIRLSDLVVEATELGSEQGEVITLDTKKFLNCVRSGERTDVSLVNEGHINIRLG